MRHARAVAILVLAAVGWGCGRPESLPEPTGWRERLREALYERRAVDGSRWGAERLDPFLAPNSLYLRQGASAKLALDALDALLRDLDRGLAMGTRERALVQRDLRAVYDWAVDAETRRHGGNAALDGLATGLVTAMARVALSRDEIDRLPGSLARGAGGGHPVAWNAERPRTPFLPPDLLDPHGPWVALGSDGGRSVVPTHRRRHADRTAFAVLVRLPGGRESGAEWVRTVADAVSPHGREAMLPMGAGVPDPPAGTTFALVGKMLLVDREGRVRRSPVVERLQLRVHGAGVDAEQPGGVMVPGQDAAFEWRFDARAWVSGGAALVPVGPDEADVAPFGDVHGDPFEGNTTPPRPIGILSTCVACHGTHLGAGRRIQSISHALGPMGPLPLLLPAAPDAAFEDFPAWKEARPEFARLRAAFAR